MSDTFLEQESLRLPVTLTTGHVLEIGLGLGLFPRLIKRQKNSPVKKITIVEKEPDVVALVYPTIRFQRTEVVITDGKDYLESCKQIGQKFDFIHIDVWQGINIAIMELEEWIELAKPCLTPDGRVWCWLQELYDRIKDKLPKEPVVNFRLFGTYPPSPCLVCGKVLRNDYAGLCMDCADTMEVSELYIRR